MAASGDMDRVLQAVLPPPRERLSLSGLCPGSGAPHARTSATPCYHDDLTGVW